jgi:hypothetical protein
MFNHRVAIYEGREETGVFTGLITENNFYIVFSLEGAEAGLKGRNFLNRLKHKIADYQILKLADLELLIDTQLQYDNLPLGFSLAAAYFKEKTIYLKTINQGQIFINRRHQFVRLLEGANSASGYGEKNDLFLITVSGFIELASQEKKLTEAVKLQSPMDIVNQLTPMLKADDDK